MIFKVTFVIRHVASDMRHVEYISGLLLKHSSLTGKTDTYIFKDTHLIRLNFQSSGNMSDDEVITVKKQKVLHYGSLEEQEKEKLSERLHHENENRDGIKSGNIHVSDGIE